MTLGHAAGCSTLSSSGQTASRALSSPASSRVVRRQSRAAVAFKKGLHPEYHSESKVICNGEEVMTTSGCKPEYVVDIWSGNHPFYQGGTEIVVTADSRVTHFNKRYEGLDIGKPAPQTAGGDKKLTFKAAARKDKKKSRKGK